MKTWYLGGLSAAVLVAGTQYGWSLAPKEVWDHWTAQAETLGLSLTAGAMSETGDTLVLEDVRYGGEWGFVKLEYRAGNLTMDPAGDDVAVSYPDETSISLAAAPPDDVAVAAEVKLTHPGAGMTVSTEGDAYVEKSRMEELTVSLASLTLDGTPVDATAEYVLSDSEFTRRYDLSDKPVLGSDMVIGSIEGGYSVSVPDEGITMSNTTASTDLKGQGEIAFGDLLPELQADLSDADEAAVAGLIGRVLDSGFSISGSSTYATNSVTDETTNEFGTSRSRVDTSDGKAEISLDAEGLSYAVTAGPFDAALAIPGVPLPEITLSGAGGETSVALPFQATETPAPFSAKVALQELVLGEPIWSMFDPSGVLPRDPATLVVALDGTMRWMADMFSAEAFESATPPAVPVSIDISQLDLQMLGANLTGTGAFTFDASDTTTIPGVPRPEGSANLSLTGGNATLEKLVQMGLVPQDQVMVVRMMMGMFAKPGAGEDELVSEIEVAPNGQILINGAPMPF